MRPEEVMGLRWEDVYLSKQYAEIKRAVTYPKKNQPVIKGTKTKKSVRTVILPKALVGILTPCAESEGFICGGEQPWTWTVMDNIKRRAYKKLRIKGFSNYDFRSTFGTQLKKADFLPRLWPISWATRTQEWSKQSMLEQDTKGS